MNASTRWVVLKFGGTSVSSRSNWDQIAGILRDRQAEGQRTLVVQSAISGMTDALGELLEHAQAGNSAGQLEGIARRHRELARELGVDASPLLDERLESLRNAADGIALLGEASDAVRARVLAQGELMATALGAAMTLVTSIDLYTKYVLFRATQQARICPFVKWCLNRELFSAFLIYC
jgi:diaminopimelate decarboxylase/aspartate kinase